jgi:hypothetical protein
MTQDLRQATYVVDLSSDSLRAHDLSAFVGSENSPWKTAVIVIACEEGGTEALVKASG